ncbi:MAG TPA: hypothetical protein VM533_07275 [Fimbriiglobus sp.]|nr:hypothetical protein [Fimbriiglobus sp.]
MSRSAICGLVVLAGGVASAAAPSQPSPDPATLAVAPEQVAKARGLVKQLGSAAYRDRDRAARELADMGRAALPALDASRHDPDPEVRMRVVALLPRAEADELRARIDTFLADADARYSHDLPAFHRFRAIAGDDRDARTLYADVLKNRANYDLLLALRGVPADRVAPLAACAGSVACAGPENPPAADLALTLAARRQEMQLQINPQFPAVGGFQGGGYRPTTPDVPDIALLLLAESLVSETKVGFNPFQNQIASYLYQDPLRRAATGEGKHGPAFRRLVIHWMDTRDSMVGLQTAMSLATQFRLGSREIARYAARQLALDGGQPWARANAAAMVARYGGREHLMAVTRLLSDPTFVVRGGINNQQPDIQVRDVALAMGALLTGQNPADYGLSAANENAVMKYQYTNFRFVGDGKTQPEAKREAALAKWRDWELGLHASLAGAPAAVPVVAAKTALKGDAK